MKPSQALEIEKFATETLGVPAGPWYSYQFDLAVDFFGSLIEAKLKITDKQGHYINKLEDLLQEKKNKKSAVTELMTAFGMMEL